MKVDFYLRYYTHFGEAIAIAGNVPVLGGNDPDQALAMSFLNDSYWHVSLELDPASIDTLHYRYILTDKNGDRRTDAEKDRRIDIKKNGRDLVIIDAWNDAHYVENAYATAPFTEVFFRHAPKKGKGIKDDDCTHIFKVKAPLLDSHEVVCLSGGTDKLGQWDTEKPLLMQSKGCWWTAAVNLPASDFALSYKYGIYNHKKDEFIRFEEGDNRVLHNDGSENKMTVVHDGFVQIQRRPWRGCGVAIPVFSLRTNNSFGVGEFADIKCLVDWCVETGIRLIQLLPINDTTATYTWKDSYPYSAISAFALHPLYINLQKVAGRKHAAIIKPLAKKQKQLAQLAELDYEQVMQFKINVLRELFDLDKLEFLREKSYKDFFDDNRSWLVPYAAFSFLRDKYSTADFQLWKTHSVYNAEEVEKLTSPKSRQFAQVAFYYFVQYQLHEQLKEAADYAHRKGIAFKGDIPIGIYRYGSDAWTAPELYNMDMQAGAPPDDFTIKGQNWGFPTYNWKRMEQDHFEWWRQRFHQMSNYFDAFRIDHILGFFRIWSIPIDTIEGILGRFIPALPVHVNEFGERGLWFDYDRFCKPYIVDDVLNQIFGGSANFVREHFLQRNNRGGYDLLPGFDTQRKVEQYFAAQDSGDDHAHLQQGLFDLISNVLLFEHPGSEGKQFHFRILIENTTSFQHLDEGTKYKLKDLYVDYFYRRQDEFWKHEAMKKLPALKDATNMLVCGEDLGMVPHSVPEVMRNLGILSLEIQRMPKNPQTEFFHPKDAPYLSVVTPSSHDMSTIRGWWEENREKTQRFFNNILGEQGGAPYFCEPWVNRAIVLQHLYAPSMWSIFQLQDLLGMSDTLRRSNPAEERINNPANPNHYWNYRMHLTLEQLIKEKEFNKELKDYITNSGRD